MSTGKEISTKVVRVSPSVKKRLEIFQGGDTPNVVIDRMLTFFEVTGYNPRYASRNPTALVEKRVEDLVRIVKSQERDIFKPILEKLAGMGGVKAPGAVKTGEIEMLAGIVLKNTKKAGAFRKVKVM